MHSRGSEPDQHIARLQLRSGDQILPVADANGKSRQVVLVLRHQPRMLRRLTADQRALGLDAALCHAGHDLRDLFRIILSAGDVVQEKQRLSARTGHIVHAHGHSIDADGIMLVHKESQLHLCPAAVSSRKQDRILHVLDLRHGERAGKTADAPQDFRTHCPLHMLFHQFHGSVSGFNIHT